MKKPFIVYLAACLLSGAITVPGPARAFDADTARGWIESMKQAERGPFTRIRWFCNDGSVLPPGPYACRERGGGRQHGEYSEQAQSLRDNGYLVANVLSGLTPEGALAGDATRLKWILLERFLVETDDGWILRRARYYRGAVQSEGETASAQAILTSLLDQVEFPGDHYLLAREAARLLPWQAHGSSLDQARALAATLAEKDPAFMGLRNKIHSFPEPADADAVREYAAGVRTEEQREIAAALREYLLQTFQPRDPAPALRQLAAAGQVPGADWQALAMAWERAAGPEARLVAAGRILAALREANAPRAAQRRNLLALSLETERAAYAAGVELLAASRSGRSRGWHLRQIGSNLDVLYGIGFLTRREWQAQRDSLSAAAAHPALSEYRHMLEYLDKVPAWTAGRYHFYFRNQLEKFAEIESRVSGFIPDRMRGSPLLLHNRLLESLTVDAARQAGVHHELFGEPVSFEVRSLNPGVARGPLLPLSQFRQAGAVAEKPVIIAPETVAELPPVAGILTAHEGNALSHVQLLARNLGIPNVVIGAGRLAEIERRIGERVVLLASPGGVVRLYPDGPEWDRWFPQVAEKPVFLGVDTGKLDLAQRAPVSLEDLRAGDSGRTVGPKAAQLGELMHHFPGRVSAGLALPFGAFRSHLERAKAPDGRSVYEWMRENYRRLDQIGNLEYRQAETSRFLAGLRELILTVEMDPALRETLEARMRVVFGEDGDYGVFVRSDTNVEDLPGFTGAGLNLTVPNVRGFGQIMDAVKSVWASPFTDRAYGWRQALMDEPEHVYASVLLHQSVPADKSGVMVTADINTNRGGTYTIAVNEGVGGGVDGQAAETLLVDAATGEVRLLASAAQPDKRILPPAGGVSRVAASGAESVLSGDEINQLVEFGKALPDRFPQLRDDAGQPVPADIEFAFTGGELFLIQIRPFLQSERARRNRLLSDLDAGLDATAADAVDLEEPPLQ